MCVTSDVTFVPVTFRDARARVAQPGACDCTFPLRTPFQYGGTTGYVCNGRGLSGFDTLQKI